MCVNALSLSLRVHYSLLSCLPLFLILPTLLSSSLLGDMVLVMTFGPSQSSSPVNVSYYYAGNGVRSSSLWRGSRVSLELRYLKKALSLSGFVKVRCGTQSRLLPASKTIERGILPYMLTFCEHNCLLLCRRLLSYLQKKINFKKLV